MLARGHKAPFSQTPPSDRGRNAVRPCNDSTAAQIAITLATRAAHRPKGTGSAKAAYRVQGAGHGGDQHRSDQPMHLSDAPRPSSRP
eukprot:scaffold1891_cov362-Prasinococcus_capsulatus_cf.AAC.2